MPDKKSIKERLKEITDSIEKGCFSGLDMG